ncbi:MAG: OsmC family protein [Anaerolineae bacterium]|nr:OsmC family protein [Anaerolineae bacterium]
MANIKSAHLDWAGEGLDYNITFSNGYQANFGSRGASPMDYMLASVAGCTGADVMHVLNKKRQKVHDLSIDITGKRADTHPMVYTEVDITFVIKGEDISPAAVERAIQLSQETYCSASIIFQRAGVDVRTSYRIEEVEIA